jgi:predicted alpha/beta-fold hydrolase
LFSHTGQQRASAAVPYRRTRWDAPDGDFIDVDWLQGPPGATLLVLFHGLEGNSSSQYAQAFAAFAKAQGMSFAMPHFRGCSGELNHGPRAYHSGDFEEIDWILKRFAASHTSRVLAAGISMGGNALMRWASEMGETAKNTVGAIASICSPLDLGASGHAIGQGFNRLIYTRLFLQTMKPKALAKLKQHPGLFNADKLIASRDLYEFDNVFTAPLHGFKNTEDYWAAASAKPYMQSIQVPALVLNALNDPFVPTESLPVAKDVSQTVTLWTPAQGGHVGFPHGWPPGKVMTMPEQVTRWLMAA